MGNWISVEDRLPENGEYVLAIYNGGNWLDDNDKREGKHTYKICKFVKGKTAEENPNGPWCAEDVFGNNKKPYCWNTFGALQLISTDVSHWQPLPEPPQ